MLPDFLLNAGLAGLGLVLATGPLGCLVVWRRMAYFGDATAHAALLGVAVALALSLPAWLGVAAVAAAFAALLLRLTRGGDSTDTVLGVLSHSALAVGLVALALLPGRPVSLEALLFGDILAVRATDVAQVWAASAVVAGLIAWRWQALLTASIGPDLARAAGFDPDREAAILTFLLALTVALALKVVGALLISALLIIPAAAARPLSARPEQMALLAVGLGALSVIGGLWASLRFDAPGGPAIICAAALGFAVTRGARALRG